MYQTAPTGEEERDGSGYQTLDTGPPGERQTFADQKAPPPTDATPAALSEGIKSGLFGMFKGPIDRALVIPKLFYFFFFSAFGSLFPLIAIYFKQNGMNATQAGVIIGIRPFVEYFSAPVWAKVAVRLKKGKILMLVSVVAWIVFTDPIAVVQTAPKYCLRLDDTTNATTYILENARGRLGSNDLPEAKATERGPKDDLENIKAGIAPIVITKADVPNYNQKQYGVLVRPPNSYKVFKQNAVEESFMLILLLVILGEFFSAPAINMADACTLHALGDTGSINYGRQRMLGSIGWGFAMFIVGIALDFSETFPDYPCSMRSSMEKNYKICFIFFSIFMLAALGVATRFVFPEENLEACSNQDDSGPEIQPPATEAKYQIMDSQAVQVDPAIAEMARSRAPEPKEQKGHWPLSTLKTFSSLHYVSFFIVPLWNGFGSGFVFAFQAVQVDPAIAEKARSRAPGPKEQKGHWLLSTLKTFSSLHYVSFFIVPLWNGFGTGFVFAFQAVQVDPAIAEKARSRAPETKEQKGHWPLSTLKTFSSLHYVSFFIVPLWNGFGTGFVFAFQAVQVDPAIAEKARSRAPEPKEQKGHWPLSTLKTFSSLHYVSFFIVPLWNGFGTGFVFAFQAVQVDPAIAEKARSRAPEPKEQKGHWLLSTLKTFSSLHYVSFFIVALWNGFGTGYVFAFLFWHLQDLGGTPFLFGLASVTNHVAEIIAHFVAFQIINRFGHIKVLYFGLMCSVLRFLYISILTSPFWVLPFELVQGVSHAVVWASATSYISLVSPAAYKNNAQSLLQGTQHGLGRGFGAIIGGIITTYQGTAFMFRLYGTLSLLVLIAYMGINRLFKIDAVKYQADGFDDAGALAPHGIPMNVPYSASNEQLDVSNGGNQAYGAADPTQDAYDKYITQDQYAKPVRFEALPDDLR